MTTDGGTWELFRPTDPTGDAVASPGAPVALPPGPPWRQFGAGPRPRPRYIVRPGDAEVVNAALHLRRPLLVTGFPGVGKSSLAEEVARQLGLGEVLRWPVNSRSTLAEALYRYDAVGRLRDANLADRPRELPEYITLGPLGTALAAEAGRPRVLLIDELDKGDFDLPSDLLTVLEDGAFEIPELSRDAGEDTGHTARVRLTVPAAEAGRAPATREITGGWLHCREFPVVVITSNGERDFSPAFLRRCVQLDLRHPDREHLDAIVRAQFGERLTGVDGPVRADIADMISEFALSAEQHRQATDQLLNAIHLRLRGVPLSAEALHAVLRPLDAEAAGPPVEAAR
ncbi:AAA family ATPase [Kitasatospora sp. NPDC006697]|uniref:AAA family ATPase n=1 Tax=Kitasatospora sp. NPDC006697 TaxID=3364020 RepID=UPI0036C0731C